MTANDALLPDATTITPRGEARFVLSHVDDVTSHQHVSGAGLAGRAAAMGYVLPDGVTIGEFAEIGDEVVGDA